MSKKGPIWHSILSAVSIRSDESTAFRLGDPHINWEESVYLNLILHGLQYTLTCAVCCRLPTQDLKVLRKQTLVSYLLYLLLKFCIYTHPSPLLFVMLRKENSLHPPTSLALYISWMALRVDGLFECILIRKSFCQIMADSSSVSSIFISVCC